ncbi:MAG: acyl carrier protein [Clostridia bacterium]|nr:acyl carrier protein [Clostridia bacterium]
MIETVKELLSKQLNIDVNSIDDDASILDDLGADSLEVVEMLMTIEDKFGIIVPDEDVPELKTVRSVAEYLQKNAE